MELQHLYFAFYYVFDFLITAMLFNTSCVCVCMCAGRHTEIFTRADFTWADSETSSACQQRQQPGCTQNSTTGVQQVGDKPNERTADKTSSTKPAPLELHPKSN